MRWIHDEDDWRHVHKTGRRLVCPDQRCTQRLRAHQNKYGTRYLSNCGDTSGCSHFIPTGGGGLMTDEHLWLQGFLRAMCLRLGFDAELEVGVTGARVDLRAEGKKDVFAFEVQRVSTDFTARREARERERMRTVWFLPESDRQKNKATGQKKSDPLFSEPCVRLGYRDGPGPDANVLTVDDLRQKVWKHPPKAHVHLRACVTIGRLAQDRQSFHSGWQSLERFVQEVLEGSRQWYPDRIIRGKNGGTWAGWLLSEEYEQYQGAVAAAEDERRRRADAERREAAREAERARILREENKEAEAMKKKAAETATNSVGSGAGELQDGYPDAKKSDASVPTRVEPKVGAAAEPVRGFDSGRPDSRKRWWQRLLEFLKS